MSDARPNLVTGDTPIICFHQLSCRRENLENYSHFTAELHVGIHSVRNSLQTPLRLVRTALRSICRHEEIFVANTAGSIPEEVISTKVQTTKGTSPSLILVPLFRARLQPSRLIRVVEAAGVDNSKSPLKSEFRDPT